MQHQAYHSSKKNYPIATIRSLLIVATLSLGFSGCSSLWWLPDAHKIDIQQGNVLEDEQIQQLKVGMNKKQVIFLLGNPTTADTFQSDQWSYYYSLSKAGEYAKPKKLRLYFKGDQLKQIDDQYLTP